MEVGLVKKINIDDEMQQAYLDYAMSVIVARALPDARDGLKPVHRRILYAMHDMGLRPDTSYKKSARIVGEVLGKYHPHGDMAVYEAMARMAQNFSLRTMLVDGQGNFGSVDGDPPAAMRYTEARLASPATLMLADIQKDTVDFSDNFDGTLTEPDVLPAALPNMLVNGATGIAVGMATSIPPHNLGEVVNALHHMLENWEKLDDVNVEDLMGFIQGPDFPTGGVIIQDSDGDALSSAYATGRGRVTVQARAHLEEMARGRNRIIVTELPYMTNKASLIERIANLVREERLEGIADLRDESDRQGMRIVIELNKAADPEVVLRELYKNTPMRSTFSINMLALVEGEPRLLGLKQSLRVYLEHRLTIIRRRSEYDLARARQRAHILEGLRVALKNLDEVIALIRRAPDVDTARTRLMNRFKLREIQAQAILDMPLRRLAALERKKIEEEYKEVQARIKELESLLRSAKKMRTVVAEELATVKDTFGDPRRTQIVNIAEGKSAATLLTATDLVPEHFVWVMATADGLVGRTAEDKLPRLSGRDVAAMLVRANTRDTLYLAAESGEAAAIPMHILPQVTKPSEGVPFHTISPLPASRRLAAVFALGPRAERAEDWFILTTTRLGMVKKTSLPELPGPAAQAFILARVNPEDRLGWVHFTDGQAEVMLVTANGMAIRFKEAEVRPMGLVASGVMGLKLQAGDEVVGAILAPERGEVFLVASDGTAKRVPATDFPTQGRYGQGVIAWKLPRGVKVAGVATGKGTTQVTLHQATLAPKTIRLDDAVRQGRAARGKSILDVKQADRVVGITVPWDQPRSDGAGTAGAGQGNGAPRGRSRARQAAATSKPATKASPSKKSAGAEVKTPEREPAARSSRTKKAAASPAHAKTARASKETSGSGPANDLVEPAVKSSRARKAVATPASKGSAKGAELPTTKATRSRKASPKTGAAVEPSSAKKAAASPATAKPARGAQTTPSGKKGARGAEQDGTKTTVKATRSRKASPKASAAAKPARAKKDTTAPEASEAKSAPISSRTKTQKPAGEQTSPDKPRRAASKKSGS